MGRTYKEYRQLLQSLLPKGAFWNKNESSDLTELLNGVGEELARVEQRGEDLVQEVFSDTITELLEEWEEDFGLPEDGQELQSTVAGRRGTIKAKKIAVGQQDEGYFIEIALALGYTITLTFFPKSLAGLMTVGDSPITPDRGLFYWMVNVWVTDPNNGYIEDLVNVIKNLQPTHTHVLFRFYNVGFSNGFDNGFNAVPWWDGSWWPLGFNNGFSIGFANNSDYNGVRLTGGYSSGFSEAFDSYRGGGFTSLDFDNGFLKPS